MIYTPLRFVTTAYITILCFLSNAVAQISNDWEYLSSGDAVNAIVLQGNTLWVGMTTGLAKVDVVTHDVYIYNKKNSGLPVNSVSSLAFNPQTQELWIGTEGGGLVKFDGQDQWSIFNETNSGLAGNWVNCLSVSPSGTIWAGIYGDTVSSFDGSTWISLRTPIGGSSIGPKAIAVHDDDEVWVGTFDGLFRLRDTVWEKYDNINSPLPTGWIQALYFDHADKLWIGTFNGVATLKDSTWVVYPKATINNNEEILNIIAIEVDSNGIAWFGGSNGYLFRFDGINWSKYFNGGSALALDLYGKLWIGGGGLVSFQQGIAEEIEVGNSLLPYDDIFRMVEDTAGVVWLATYQGIYKGDETGWEFMLYGWFDVLEIGEDNKIWAAGPYGDMYFYDGSQFVPFNPPGVTFRVTAILTEQDGTVWAGTVEDGIYRYNNGFWQHFPSGEFGDDGQYYVTCIAHGPDGKIWAGVGYSLYAFDGSIWWKSNSSSIPTAWVADMETDQNGNFWLCNSEWGLSLAKFDGSTWTAFGQNQQLYGVGELVADYAGGIWASTRYLLHIQENGQFDFFTPFNSGFPGFWTSSILARKSGDVWAAIADYGGVAILHNAFTVETQEGDKKKEMFPAQILPNPAIESFEVVLHFVPNTSDNLYFDLYSLEGKILRHESFLDHRLNIAREGLPTGFYFWRIIQGNGHSISSGKIIFSD